MQLIVAALVAQGAMFSTITYCRHCLRPTKQTDWCLQDWVCGVALLPLLCGLRSHAAVSKRAGVSVWGFTFPC